MTDQTEPAPEPAPEPATGRREAPIVAVPSYAWMLDVEDRLRAAEERGDRHRLELEDIKTNQNQLGEYVERQLPIRAVGGYL